MRWVQDRMGLVYGVAERFLLLLRTSQKVAEDAK
jgi:hypothetical protein